MLGCDSRISCLACSLAAVLSMIMKTTSVYPDVLIIPQRERKKEKEL